MAAGGQLLKTPSRSRAAGFSLVESMIVVVILGIVATIGYPQFKVTLGNYKVRTATEGILMGLKLARTEAIRLNTNVQFILAAGGGWSVAQVAPATPIQTRPGSESGGGVAVASTNDQLALTFTSTGRVLDYNPASNLTMVAVSASGTGADTLQIDVFAGGQARMCNRSITLVDDPRKC
ncbi:MAG TPA: GspH/FimT family pseudopilin [Azospira sp.]|nr:GspH/FimT family pseudopilin [Azospira sp.]